MFEYETDVLFITRPHMEPITTLKKGLKKLQDQSFTRKTSLEAALRANQVISQADEEWLDHEGNLVNEERLVCELDNALDYESACENLTQQDKALVQRLIGIAHPGQTSKKHKRSVIFEIWCFEILSILQVPHLCMYRPC